MYVAAAFFKLNKYMREGGRNSAESGSGRAICCKKLRNALLYISERALRRHRAYTSSARGQGWWPKRFLTARNGIRRAFSTPCYHQLPLALTLDAFEIMALI